MNIVIRVDSSVMIGLTGYAKWLTVTQEQDALETDDGVRIYVLMQDNLPVGQVRLVFEDSMWQISYSIASAYRGQGYGKRILQLAENELISRGRTGEKLFAEVKAHNTASQ